MYFFIIIVSKQSENVIFHQLKTYKITLPYLLQLPEKAKTGATTTTVGKMQFYSGYCPESVSPRKVQKQIPAKIMLLLP